MLCQWFQNISYFSTSCIHTLNHEQYCSIRYLYSPLLVFTPWTMSNIDPSGISYSPLLVFTSSITNFLILTSISHSFLYFYQSCIISTSLSQSYVHIYKIPTPFVLFNFIKSRMWYGSKGWTKIHFLIYFI